MQVVSAIRTVHLFIEEFEHVAVAEVNNIRPSEARDACAMN